MNVATRLPLLLSFLIGVFVAATGLAVVVLASLRDPVAGLAAGIAAVASIAAAAITWLLVRSLRQPEAPQANAEEDAKLLAPCRPLRVESLPAAELPPAYLAAVRKGVEANRAALKARSLHH